MQKDRANRTILLLACLLIPGCMVVAAGLLQAAASRIDESVKSIKLPKPLTPRFVMEGQTLTTTWEYKDPDSDGCLTHTVTTPCEGNPPAQCVAQHQAMVDAMKAVYPPKGGGN